MQLFKSEHCHNFLDKSGHMNNMENPTKELSHWKRNHIGGLRRSGLNTSHTQSAVSCKVDICQEFPLQPHCYLHRNCSHLHSHIFRNFYRTRLTLIGVVAIAPDITSFTNIWGRTRNQFPELTLAGSRIQKSGSGSTLSVRR